MLTTEKEAQKLWCSHALVSNYLFAIEQKDDAIDSVSRLAALVAGSQTHNRLVLNRDDELIPGNMIMPNVNTCIGSRCASWRWAKTESVEQCELGHEPVGYCGRAGRPE
jgi:hypothetical protein